MEWFPIVAGSFKVVALCIGMFFAVKWHYDQGKKKKQLGRGALLRAGGTVAVVFVLSLLGLMFATYFIAGKMGLDLAL